jgi:hypothetical protein
MGYREPDAELNRYSPRPIIVLSQNRRLFIGFAHQFHCTYPKTWHQANSLILSFLGALGVLAVQIFSLAVQNSILKGFFA